MNNTNDSRKEFIRKALKGIAGLFLKDSPLLIKDEPKSKKIKMLTEDGKLVEVDQNVLDQNLLKHQASHREIVEWISKKE